MIIGELKKKLNESQLDKPTFIHEMHKVHERLFEYSEALPSTDVKKIEITSDGVYFTVKHRALNHPGDGVTFLVDPLDHRVMPIETFNFDSYENEDFKMIVSLLKDGQVFLDIGGNIGFHSLSLSKQFPNSKFFAFEPLPKTFKYLEKNKELNHASNVSIFNLGLCDSEGELEFFFYPEGSGNASTRNLSGRADAIKVKSPVTTLDLWMKKNPTPVDFIKCDVEGAEWFVFKGAKETIEKFRPIVFSEILRKWSRKFDYEPNEIFDFFTKLNYSAFTAHHGELKKFGRMNEETVETNFFFMPNEKMK